MRHAHVGYAAEGITLGTAIGAILFLKIVIVRFFR